MPSSPLADQPHRYSADRPLEDLKDDRLERKGFVQRLAADIASWHGADSLVISLSGTWGSGKTSLKNFLRGELRVRSNPLIVEFNPWQWSGQDRVFDAFFSAMRTQFQQTDSSRETEKLAARWESFARWTKFGAAISTKVEQAVTPLLGSSVIGALLAGVSPRPEVRYLGVGLVVIGVTLSAFFSVAPEIATAVVEYVRGKLGHGKKELAELREAITAQLNKLKKEGRPVLVIIDDIDRLTQDEIRIVFQLVKANADFPNVVYLLLFQKDIVVSALSKVIADCGEDYLKKIVQVEFDVPQAPRRKMLQIFQDDLIRIFDRTKPKMYWDKDRIQGLFEKHLWPYFRTLRDVKRFLGTFDYYFSGHVNGGVLEVNPIDLLAIEVLRNFDHDAFVAVRDTLGFASREDFVRALMGDEERKKQVDAAVESLRQRASLSPRERERVGVVLRNLFPDGGDETKHEHDLRICHPKHFDKYFEHAMDESATSAASVEAILAMTSDRAAFSARLREVVKTGTFAEVLEKLGVYFENIPAEAAPSFVTALFDVGEEFPVEGAGFLSEDRIRANRERAGTGRARIATGGVATQASRATLRDDGSRRRPSHSEGSAKLIE